MTNQHRSISPGILLAAIAGGLFTGYVDLTAAEVQGPALILMLVAFLCAAPRRAPAWLVAVVATAGLPIMHIVGTVMRSVNSPANAGMLIALVPALIAAYAGALFGKLLDATSSALRGSSETRTDDRASSPASRPAIVFAGLAVWGLVGIPAVRSALGTVGRSDLLILSNANNTLFIACIWQAVTLCAWAALAPLIVRRHTALHLRHERTGTSLAAADFLMEGFIVFAATLVHAVGLFAVALVLHISVVYSGLAVVALFFVYLPLDALAYISVRLLAYTTDRNRMMRESARRAAELTAALDQSTLAALNAQLRPHFMFNALNSVVVLARRGDADGAGEAASALADLMRYVLVEDDARGATTLRDEIQFVRSYLDLERIRFPDRLHTTIECDEGIAGMTVPRLILQPVVENAVRHGVSQRIEAGTIRVVAESTGGVLQISVMDNGPGYIETNGSESGLGLRATRSRLAAYYGDRADMKIVSMQPHGTRVLIRIPLS